MLHYVCLGDCGGESEHPGVCEAEGCSHQGEKLTECNCEDGLHKGVVKADESEEPEPDMETMDDEDEL